MPNTTNNLSETKQFIEALFSRYFKDHDGHVELRLIGQDTGSKFYSKGEIGENDWAEIERLNASYHVYFGVNPRPLSRAKKQDDIVDVVCLWADVDGKDFEGGKEEALRRARGFPIAPSIVADSGHGCHCYWMLAEPIIGLAGEQRLRFKRILAGLVKELGGDRSRVNLDSCLRLPGTLNIKEGGPIACRILALTDQVYGLEDFERFEDAGYQEPAGADEPLPAFGSKTKSISLDDAQSAKADVEGLEISSKTKNLILTGSLLREKGADRTRSGRDFSIICSLIYWDYDYQTIHSVFFNPFLGCSNRITQEGNGEKALKWDVQSALKRVQKRRSKGTPQSMQIAAIKSTKYMTVDQKRQEIGAFIVQDLLTGPEAAGRGFKDQDTGAYYFFDKEEKMLMALTGTDFYCFMRERFGLANKDFEEYRDAVMAAIWTSKSSVVPRRFAYWSQDEFTLYVSDNANGVHKLDGMKIELCDNGVDGVFFEYDPSLLPFTFNRDLPAVNYFESPAKRGSIELDDLGLDLERFDGSDNLLRRFLIDRASFTQDAGSRLSPEAHRLLLVVYFYSLFFESMMREKPVACFIGTKESGKSFLASSIGKIFFGDRYESTGLPKSPHDLAVVMEKRPYLVIDNLDSYLKSEMLNLLCAVATGVTEANRALYTDNDMIWFTPRCFLAITSREPKFTRDDFVSRLLVFNMQKIDNPLSRSELIDSLLQNRSAIMAEALANLNSIVKILLLQEDRKLCAGKSWRPTPCYSRLADWETFGRKICCPSTRDKFTSTIQSMNQTKDEFVLEDDQLYQVLNYAIYEGDQTVRDLSAQELYSRLVETSEGMKMEGFAKHYRNARSMAKHLANIVSELRQKFVVDIIEKGGRRKLYSFKAIGGDQSVPEETTEAVETPARKSIERPTDEVILTEVVRRAAELRAKDPNFKLQSAEELEAADLKRWDREEKERQAGLGNKEDGEQADETSDQD
ncbi:MAG: hypothetical protein ABSG73_01150 [Candidatus Aminicenantales bacterium]|jgi:hypothetical protein